MNIGEHEEDLREKIKPPYKPDEVKRPHRLSQYKDNDINHRSGARQNNQQENGDTHLANPNCIPAQCCKACALVISC
jgi:hypothetical protein